MPNERQICGCLNEYRCSRCGKCYRCKHVALYLDAQDKWVWKNRAGKFEPVIMDNFVWSTPNGN